MSLKKRKYYEFKLDTYNDTITKNSIVSNAANILLLLKLNDIFNDFIIYDTFENIHKNISNILINNNLIVIYNNLNIIGISIYRLEIKYIQFNIIELSENKYHIRVRVINKLKLYNALKEIKNMYSYNLTDTVNLQENTCELLTFINENIKLLIDYNYIVNYEDIYKSYNEEKKKFIIQNNSKSLFEFVLKGFSKCKIFCEDLFKSPTMFNILIKEFDKYNNIFYLNNLYIIAYFDNSIYKAKIIIDKILTTIQTNVNEFKKILYLKVLNDILINFNIKLDKDQLCILQNHNNIKNLIDMVYELFFPKLKSILFFNKI